MYVLTGIATGLLYAFSYVSLDLEDLLMDVPGNADRTGAHGGAVLAYRQVPIRMPLRKCRGCSR